MPLPHLIDLSHPIVPDMPQWPGDGQPLEISRLSRHGPDSHMSSALRFGCHVGTHIDAPLHFLDGAPSVDTMPLERFCGPALVVRCPDGDKPGALGPELLDGHDLAGIDFVLFATGLARHWGTPRYYAGWSYLSPALARRLADAGLKGVGLDTPSLDPFGGQEAHDICAPAGLINIENLADLSGVPDRGWELMVFPLRLHGTEASPVRAVARLEAQP